MHGRTLLAVTALALGSATAVAPAEPPTTTRTVVDHPVLERMVVREINRVRRLHGRRAVTIRPRLSLAAANHGNWLVARGGRLRHRGPGGAPFWQRLKVSSPSPWGEVLARYWTCRSADVREVVRSWLGSPSHRGAILAPRYRTAGVSILAEGRCAQGVYVVDFAG